MKQTDCNRSLDTSEKLRSQKNTQRQKTQIRQKVCAIKHIGDEERITISPVKRIRPRSIDMAEYVEKHGWAVLWKPSGLWYAIGTEWINWCKIAMPHWLEDQNVFRLKIHTDKILFVDTPEKLEAFDQKYKVYRGEDALRLEIIDWLAIAEEYHGVEIAPYFRRHRLDFFWYHGWDVASGCIWNKRAIARIEKMGKLRKQPSKLTIDHYGKIHEMVQDKQSARKIANHTGFSVSTVYRIIKRLRCNSEYSNIEPVSMLEIEYEKTEMNNDGNDRRTKEEIL